MSKLNKLIESLCPNGVKYKPLWSLTAWDKKFNGIEKEKQKKVVSYKYYLSSDFDKVETEDGNIKYISTGILGKDRYTTEQLAKDYIAEGEIVCIPWGGTPNVKYHKGKFVTGDNRIATSIDTNTLNNKFLYYWMQSNMGTISTFYRGSGIKHPNMKNILDMCIPVPPLEIQCEIVHILDEFTELSAELSAELKARQKQYEYYRDNLFKYDNIQYVPLKELCKSIKDGMHNLPKNTIDKSNFPILSAQNVFNGKIDYNGKRYVEEEIYLKENKRTNIEKGDVLLTIVATIGRTAVIEENKKFLLQRSVCILKPNERINPYYLKFYLDTYKVQDYMRTNAHGSAQSGLYLNQVAEILVPVPSMQKQERIVDILNKFDKLCNDISEGLPAEIEARQKQYEYYRDKLLTFKELKINE